MKKDELSLMDWTKKSPAKRAGGRSQTLKYPEEVRKAIHEFLKLKVAGKAPQPISQFHDEFLVPRFDYQLDTQSLIRYMKTHEKELWRKVKEYEGRG